MLIKEMTNAESYLWDNVLNDRQLKGYQFHKQRPISDYLVDFVCLELRLVIEVDDYSHFSEKALLKDEEKTFKLEEAGFSVLRFADEFILNRINDVRSLLGYWMDTKTN